MKLDKNKIYLGIDADEGSLVVAEIKEGLIRGFEFYNEVELADGDLVLSWCAWTHDAEINGKKYITGDKAPKATKSIEDDTMATYFCESVHYCESCWAAHDSENSSDCIMTDCAIYCKGCATAAKLVRPFNTVEDLFKAPVVEDLDHEGLEELETLFCDSSGWGNDREPALTKAGAERAAENILREHEGQELFVGITGVGQFQVYVTIFRKI